jgi:Ca2+-binding RTX toxin-like protein
MPLAVEPLEDRRVLATLDITGGALTYTAGMGESNQPVVSVVNGVLRFAEASGIAITLTGAGTAGWSGGGTSAVSGPVASVTAASQVLLQDMNDKLVLQGFPAIALSVDGGTGSDTLSRAGATINDSWNLTASGAGNIIGVASFAGIENLVGGGKNDTFKVDDAGSLAGTIDGGGGVMNKLDYSPTGSPVTFSLNNQTVVSAVDTIPFKHVQRFAGSTASDTLIGLDSATYWQIQGANEVWLLIPGSQFAPIFSSVENLQGGTEWDSFQFHVGSISGSINGGGGRNRLDYQSNGAGIGDPGVAVDLAVGSATMVGGGIANVNYVVGSNGNDTLIGDGNNNVLDGGAGLDMLYGGGGDDGLNGGADLEDDYIDGGAGVNSLLVLSVLVPSQIFLTDYYVADNASSDTFVNIQSVTIDATDGNDGIDASDFSGSLSVYARAGDDTVIGGTGINFLKGDAGNDTLTGLSGTDTLEGGDGTDILTGGGGNDKLYGGAGNDRLSGEAGADTLYADAGNDTLSGGAGNDAYLFDADTDVGIDTIIEAGGIDRISFYPTTTLGVVLNLGLAAQQQVNTNLLLKVADVEQVTGSAKDDILVGNNSNNRLWGGDGNDVLVGNGGADVLEGQNGRDILIGGGGADTLTGGSETDILIGGNTTYYGNTTPLQSLMAEWSSANSYSVRIGHLTGAHSGGLNGTYTLHGAPSATVLDDAIADILTGDDYYDWFLGKAGEPTDKVAAETLTII